MGRTNDGVAFPMSHLQPLVNVRWALAQRSAVGDFSAAIPTTDVALFILLLATKVLPQRATRVNLQVERIMAHWQFAGDLLGTPLQPQKRTGLFFHPGRKGVGVAARFGAFVGKFTGLFGSVASTPSIATQLVPDRGLVTSKQSGNLRDVALGFHKAVNLINFNLAEVFVVHQATSTCRSGSLEC